MNWLAQVVYVEVIGEGVEIVKGFVFEL